MWGNKRPSHDHKTITWKKRLLRVLGVSKGATKDEIKRPTEAGVEISSRQNPGDKKAEDMFKEAAEAYEVLVTTIKERNTIGLDMLAWVAPRQEEDTAAG